MMAVGKDFEPEVVKDAGQAFRLRAELVGMAQRAKGEVHGVVEAS